MEEAGPHNTVALKNGRDPGCVTARSNREVKTEMGSEVIDDAA
jgi:hypothetical protein